jgi:aspartyl-tRNA(Asn)/glutamyl-tRNA(Gln) amidotransferase subunit C
MKITDELLLKLASLARLNIDDSKKEKMKEDLSEIITWMEKLSEVDTTGVEPLTNMSREVNRYREDVAGQPMERKIALGNAPDHDDEFFKVPKVLKKKK